MNFRASTFLRRPIGAGAVAASSLPRVSAAWLAGWKVAAMMSVGLILGSRLAAQVVVNIDFNERSGTYSGQGAYSDPGNNFWNGVTSTSGGSNFIASDGVTNTGISFSVSDVSGLGWGGDPAFAGNLMADYLYRYSGSTASFTIDGLTPGALTHFYFYSQPGSSGATDRSTVFTLDGASLTATGGNPGAFVSGTNFVMFSVTPAGASLSGTFGVSPGHGEAGLNGVQIVVSAVPEPSTYAVLAGVAVLVGAMAMRRRRIGRPLVH